MWMTDRQINRSSINKPSSFAIQPTTNNTNSLFYVYCVLDLGDTTLGQGHDTPLGYRQQFCEILSRSNIAMRRYGPDTNLWNVGTVSYIDLGDMTFGQDHDTPLGHGQQLCEILPR